jgi:primosomal protein N'
MAALNAFWFAMNEIVVAKQHPHGNGDQDDRVNKAMDDRTKNAPTTLSLCENGSRRRASPFADATSGPLSTIHPEEHPMSNETTFPWSITEEPAAPAAPAPAAAKKKPAKKKKAAKKPAAAKKAAKKPAKKAAKKKAAKKPAKKAAKKGARKAAKKTARKAVKKGARKAVKKGGAKKAAGKPARRKKK